MQTGRRLNPPSRFDSNHGQRRDARKPSKEPTGANPPASFCCCLPAASRRTRLPLRQSYLIAFDGQHLDEHLIAELARSSRTPRMRCSADFADVEQAVGTGEDLDERAELSQANDFAEVRLADFGGRRDFRGLICKRGVGRHCRCWQIHEPYRRPSRQSSRRWLSTIERDFLFRPARSGRESCRWESRN